MTVATQLDKDIGARLRALRGHRQLAQPRVAKHLGVSYQSYQKMEAGKVSFRASTLVKLAEFFGTTAGELIHGA